MHPCAITKVGGIFVRGTILAVRLSRILYSFSAMNPTTDPRDTSARTRRRSLSPPHKTSVPRPTGWAPTEQVPLYDGSNRVREGLRRHFILAERSKYRVQSVSYRSPHIVPRTLFCTIFSRESCLACRIIPMRIRQSCCVGAVFCSSTPPLSLPYLPS